MRERPGPIRGTGFLASICRACWRRDRQRTAALRPTVRHAVKLSTRADIARADVSLTITPPAGWPWQFDSGYRNAKHKAREASSEQACTANRAAVDNDVQVSSECQSKTSGRMCGNNSTSRMDSESVNNMTSRSMPTPIPAVGGMPYSRARM